MRTVIREGCFETNSSSMHNITVLKKGGKSDAYDYDHTVRDGVLNMSYVDTPLDFGRIYNVYYTIVEKAAYAFASLGEECKDRIVDILKRNIPGVKFIIFNKDEKPILGDENNNPIPREKAEWVGWGSEDSPESGYVYTDENGIRHPLYTIGITEVDDLGGIDHQSMGLLKNFLKKHDVSLEDFITNSKYIIVQDGDEYDIYRKELRSHIIDTDRIEYIHSGDGIDRTVAEFLDGD